MRRHWKKVGKAGLGLLLTGIAYYLLPFFWDAFRNDEVLITISPEITNIEEPLGSDGYIDYYAAIESRASAGVTTENNAVVVLWEVFGPANVPPQVRDKYFSKLGVTTPKLSADNLQDWQGMVKADQSLWPATSDAYERLAALHEKGETEHVRKFYSPHSFDYRVENLSNWACMNLWTALDFPDGEKWLSHSEPKIERLIAGSLRTKFYSPLVQKEVDEPLFMIDDCTSTHLPAISSVLRHYAMAKLREGNNAAALEAILALMRWARLASQGSSLPSWMHSEIMGQHANITLAAAACTGKLGSRELEEITRKMVALSEPITYAQYLAQYERLRSLDHHTQIARRGFDYLEPEDKPASPIYQILQRRKRRGIDWNQLLLKLNILIDCHNQLLSESTAKEKEQASERYTTLSQQLEADDQDWYVTVLMRSGTPGGVLHRRVQALLLLEENKSHLRIHYIRGLRATSLQIPQVALALCKYRADHGSYPKDLADLHPKYWKENPIRDKMYDSLPLVYQREGEEFLLYSFGQNGRDDKASDYRDYWSKGDDIVFRSQPALIEIFD